MCYNVFVTSARFFRAFLPMASRQAVLLTPSISSLRLIHGVSSAQIMHETPQIPFFVFKSLHTLSFPYPVSPVFVTLTRTAGMCTNNSHSGIPRLLATLSSLFSHSCALFCTQQKINPFVFKQIHTLCPKHPGVGGAVSVG